MYDYEEWRKRQAKPKPVKTFVPPYALIRDDGETWLYYDLYELAQACSAAKVMICLDHGFYTEREFVRANGEWTVVYKKYKNEFCVRDDRGQVISRDEVYASVPKRDYCSERLAVIRHAMENHLPIPRTGKRGWGWSKRHHKFFQAYRDYATFSIDEEVKEHKIKVNKSKLPPTNWDDPVRGCLYNRNWKRFRKTQWKG
jgi:hypothetical protein